MNSTPVYRRRVQFRVLGPLEVDAGDGPIPLGGPKQRTVLANLLIRPNQVVPAEVLIDELWGEEPPENARNTLQTHVSNLRKAVGAGRLEGRSPGYALVVGPDELDLTRFEALVRDAKRTMPVDPKLAVASLDAALALWRGPALADVADQSSLTPEAARLEELRLDAQQARIEGSLAYGDEASAVGELEAMVARHPLRESLWGLLMLALYREGRQADALDAFRRARDILSEQLGIDPSPELLRLQERVLQQDPSLELRGEPLRGYRLLEKIGEGSAGAVFRAIQPHVERDVAVRIFHPRIADDPDFVQRFEPEAQAVAALEHPHIVPVYDYWREPGGAYLVARYLRGGSLRTLEDRGEAFEPDHAARVVEQVSSGLAFAHQQGVAHGCVSASNVLLDAEGNAYLGDFPIGIGAPADPADDVRALAALARSLLGDDVPASLAEPTGSETLPTLSAGELRNPYKGLRAFTEPDALDFFGRTVLTRCLVARLSEPDPGSRFLAVVGPSGCGKSSVVRAGLVPAIRRGAVGDAESWFVADMFPGAHPIDELEAALQRIALRPAHRLHDLLDGGSRGLLDAVDLIVPQGAEVLLVVDQFEEAFTLAADERERVLFLESLRVAAADPASRLRIVVTLRADFYDRPLAVPRFGELLAARNEAIPPLTPDELEQAIRMPAERVGVSSEPGLVAEMIADVAHQPGALPLLQYALTELFEGREDSRMTLAAYRELGGAAGALSARADRLFEGAAPAGRRAIRQVFLRLVTLGEGRQDTRRRVARSELGALEVEPTAIDGVLDAYGRHRLLTFDREPPTREPTVEIAHEALLGTWGRLRAWIDEAREDLRQDRRLARAASEWGAADQDPSFLMRGARLDQVEAWSGSTALAIGRPERAYLKASVDERDRERGEEERRREHEAQVERRSVRRLRGLVAVFAIAALVAGTLTFVAANQSERARLEARIATARELAAAALNNLEVDPERSILLAVEAVELARSDGGSVLPEVQEALHRAVVASRIVMSVPGVGGRLDWSPTGDVFATEGSAGSGVVDIRDVQTGRSIRSFPGHDGDITDVAFGPDGSMLATTGVDGFLKVWDPADGALLLEVSGVGEARGPSFSDDGRLAAAAWPEEGAVRIVNTSTDRVVRSFGDLRGANATSLGPGGARIAVSTVLQAENDTFSHVYLVDVASSDRLRVEGIAALGQVDDVAWSPDGDLVAAGADLTLRIWEAATGELRHSLSGHSEFITSVDWRPGPPSRVLVTGGEDGTARVWRIEEGGATRTMSLLSSEMTNVTGVAFSPDGTRVMTGNDLTSPGIKIWDVSATGSAEWVNLPADVFGEARFLSAWRLLASGGGGPWSDSVTLWDIEAASEPRRLRTFHLPGSRPCCVWDLDVSADGGTAAMAWFDDGASVRDVATGDELFFVPAPEDVATPSDLSPDGRYLAVGMGRDRGAGIRTQIDYENGAYRAVRILDRSGHEVGTPLREDGGFRIDGFRFAPDSRLIATASHRGADQRVRIWDRERGVVVTEIAVARFDPGWAGFTMAFDPSGRLIASVADRQVRIWDVESGALVATLPSQPSEIIGVAFSPDGASVATAANDGTVRLFDLGSETQRLVLHGSHFDAHSAAFANPGALQARSVAFSPDGSLLASVDGTTVRVWALDIDDLLEIARQNVTRSLTDEECRQYLHVDACAADSTLQFP